MKIMFLWENFGPMHADRCGAVAEAIGEDGRVIGLELYGRSDVYEWIPETREQFRKHTLSSVGRPSGIRLIMHLLRFRRSEGRGIWFLCHYEKTEIMLFAWWLRICGDTVFTMGCSKLDDQSRRPFRELLKSVYLWPYRGAIGSGVRSRDYFRFLGMKPNRIVGEYNTLSVTRVRALSGQVPAPGGTPFADRHFIVVARLVPKKNLFVALKAYALYVAQTSNPRTLHLCGSGPLDSELRACAKDLGIVDNTVFHGFVQSDEIAGLLGRSLALILPSVEEQFGNVVIEAQAMGLPVIVSENCGARDLLVRSGINGFVVEPDNPLGIALFMQLLSVNQEQWEKMARAAADSALKGDVVQFAAGVRSLLELTARDFKTG